MITRRKLGGVSIATVLTALPAASWSDAIPEVITSGSSAAMLKRTFRIDRNTTISADVMADQGTRFEIAAGAVLTFTGDLIAPASPMFKGLGLVDLTRSRVIAARPEWWGAVADDPLVDCGPALQACLRSHLAMQLGCGDYHIAGTWHIDQPNRRVWGVGRSKGFRGTRIVLRGGRGTVVLVGTVTSPATTNDFLWGVDIRSIELSRSVTPVFTPDGRTDISTGLQVRHVVDCVFEELRANEHAIGFSVHGAVRTFFRECSAFRSTSADAAHDIFVGFDMDGRHPSPAIATGANASLYLIDCVAATGDRQKLSLSTGCRLTGAMSDTFIDRFETANVGIGILFDGQRLALDAAQRRAGHVDIHIRAVVLDQCSDTGIRMVNLSEDALVDIIDPYVALAPGGTVAIDIADCGGCIEISGGQCIGWTATSPAVIGLRLQHVSGISVSGAKLAGFTLPIIAIKCTAFELIVGISHQGSPVLGPVIQLTDCRHGYIRPRLASIAGSYKCGVEADSDCDAIEITMAGMPPAAFATGDIVRVDGKRSEASAQGRRYLICPRPRH